MVVELVVCLVVQSAVAMVDVRAERKAVEMVD